MNVALVHDWMNQIGGAEDVLEALVNLYPYAPVFTSMYAPNKMPAHWQNWDIRTTFLDKLPLIHKKQQLYFPLYPLAFEQHDFRGYDLVISNKSGFCHGIITDPETTHICYCLTPTRYVWRYHQYAEQENLGRMARGMLQPFLGWLRVWDRLAADRVDHFIAISQEVRRRIGKVYRREATIIYPPVDVNRFAPANQVDDYFLIVGRLVPYRRIDLLIESFNKMQRPLLIAGHGRDRERLESLAGPTIQFLGYVPDEDLPDLYARCRAFMFPGEEDFGIAPIQAMAAGRPVIAYAAGGALDTVISGQTGILFNEQTGVGIMQAVDEFEEMKVNTAIIRQHAEKFDIAIFQEQMTNFIHQKMDEASP
ncbi:MAG: glycosyltransferase family 4 protein [Chloroflexi bacterium]|nr:glycosyltransferase family 4 protein [Chloroflexota bacterium]